MIPITMTKDPGIDPETSYHTSIGLQGALERYIGLGHLQKKPWGAVILELGACFHGCSEEEKVGVTNQVKGVLDGIAFDERARLAEAQYLGIFRIADQKRINETLDSLQIRLKPALGCTDFRAASVVINPTEGVTYEKIINDLTDKIQKAWGNGTGESSGPEIR